MTNSHPTFAKAVPATFLGRPRSVYEARYQPKPRQATVSQIVPAAQLPAAA